MRTTRRAQPEAESSGLGVVSKAVGYLPAPVPPCHGELCLSCSGLAGPGGGGMQSGGKQRTLSNVSDWWEALHRILLGKGSLATLGRDASYWHPLS